MNERERATLCRDIATHWQIALDQRDRFFSEIEGLRDQQRDLNSRLAAIQSQILELEFASKIPNRLGSGAVGLGLSVLEDLAASRHIAQLEAEEREISSELFQVRGKIKTLESNHADVDPAIRRLASQYDDLNCQLYAAKSF
jgi:prefoldin subunit 5